MIYRPREDSFLLEKFVEEYAKGKKVLDVGCGSGIQIEAAFEGGAESVLGVDIDEESVDFCRKKALNVLKSDLFDDVEGKFELVIFNPPYLPEDDREDEESRKATSGGRRGDEIIVRFLSNVGKHIKKDGKILLVVSSLTTLKKIERVLTEKNLVKKVIASENFFMERLDVWEIGILH
ncbi:methyltransferase [Candidatus Pacearchaeota archaeon]|nr:methyltransferase [Candidatus Pacearchaeota archaeon]